MFTRRSFFHGIIPFVSGISASTSIANSEIKTKTPELLNDRFIKIQFVTISNQRDQYGDINDQSEILSNLLKINPHPVYLLGKRYEQETLLWHDEEHVPINGSKKSIVKAVLLVSSNTVGWNVIKDHRSYWTLYAGWGGGFNYWNMPIEDLKVSVIT
jgi:hypothetical protein